MSVAAFDLDGTLLRHNCSFSFCRYLRKQRLLTRSDLFYCSALYTTYLLFGLSLRNVHMRAFKRTFRGKSVATLTAHIEPFLQTLNWYQPALVRLNELRKSGMEIHILSNSPRFLVEPIAASIGVDKVLATDYKIDNTGCLWDIASLVDGEKKRQVLQAFGRETIAFSDNHQDLPFLDAASQAVAVNPTRRLLKIAQMRNWEIL